MNDVYTIAIDGPAGAGKTTVSRDLANKLNILHLDTGAMYRASAMACLQSGIEKGDTNAIIKVVNDSDITVEFQNGEQKTMLNGECVNHLIRTPEVSLWASDVSAVPEVRLKLVEIQRDLSKKISMVIDGRDIGTYVLPDADFKIFMTADQKLRAERRYKELIAKGVEVDFEEVLQDQLYRDEQDTNREFAPLKAAEDAFIFDTTGLSISECADIIIDYMNKNRSTEC